MPTTPRHRITSTLAATLALASIAPAASTARPVPADQPFTASKPAVQVVTVTHDSGFDWGDAGIGAVGGIGIAMLASGGGLLAVRLRRDHLDAATR